LTSIYPSPDDEKSSGLTPVVHYFAREWVKLGHEVLVINNKNKYPFLFYMVSKKIKDMIASKYSLVIPNIKQRKEMKYNLDGVKVFRIPILKMMPWGGFFSSQLKAQYKKIKAILDQENFKPDIVIGHWENPQIPLLAMFKKEYLLKTVIVFHGVVYIKKYNSWKTKYIPYIDIFGYRSNTIRKTVESILGAEKKGFICYSGVPDSFVDDISINENRFTNGKLTKYIYVGRLIERKNVDTIILALSQLENDKMLKIVGAGEEEEYLKKLCQDKNMAHRVNFMGRQKREDVIKLMQMSECFIMVSKNETFGLVYLEAMLQGCIVVASKNEGIDGIIIHGENGFLCNAGDVNELTKTLKYIDSLTGPEKKRISENAIKTALQFTDSKVADYYLRQIIQ